jgi:hypothetical protein
VLTLVEHLPEDSALFAALRGGPQHRPWTTRAYLAAGACNALAAGNWQRGGGKGPRPEPITGPPRPAESARRRSIRAWRAEHIAARAGR